ncbi:MAG: hypothetical protein ACP5JR_07945 [Thermoplasmata archaeon]
MYRSGLEQLKSYCNAEGAPIGVWSNGNEMIRLHREEPNIFVEIPRIPKVTETLRDILTERWTSFIPEMLYAIVYNGEVKTWKS